MKFLKAQVSMEYMIIIGFVTAIIVPLLLIFNAHSTEINEDIIANEADTIASKIADSAESVYYLGETSKVTFRVYMPKKINEINISGNEIVFFIKKSNGVDEVVKYVPIPINGSLSKESGIQKIVVESKGDYVWVSNQ